MTFPPEQKVVAPLTEMVGVLGTFNKDIVIGDELDEQVPLEKDTL